MWLEQPRRKSKNDGRWASGATAMATESTQAPPLGSSCHSAPATSCQVPGFSREARHWPFFSFFFKTWSLLIFKCWQLIKNIFLTLWSPNKTHLQAASWQPLLYGRVVSLPRLPGVASCLRDLWRTVAVWALKSLNLRVSLRWCLARVVNDTVIVSFVKGIGTEVARAGGTSYT